MSSPITPDLQPSRPPTRPEAAPSLAQGASPAGAGVAAAVAAADAPVLGGLTSAIALALTMFVEAVGYGVVAPTLPFLARQAGADESRIGFLVGLYAAVGFFASIPCGALANRYGRRTLILAGLACLMLASLGFVVAPDYSSLVLARLVQGLGAVAIWVGTLTVAADLSPGHSMGRSLSWITGSWSLGFVVGPAMGGIGGVRTPFIIYTVLSGVAFLLALAALPETGRPGTRTTLAGILKVLRYPAVLASAAATIALAFFYGAIEAFVPLIMDAGGVSRAGIGLLFAVGGLPAVLLPRVTGHLADRVGDARVIVGGLLFGMILNALFLVLLGAVPPWIVFVLVGLVEVLVYVPAVALLHRGLSNEDRIFATGSHSYAFSTGFFFGPLLGGLLLPIGGYPLLFGLLSAIMVAAIAGVLAGMARRG
jgi:predicted MFS family arabinose efflux permease